MPRIFSTSVSARNPYLGMIYSEFTDYTVVKAPLSIFYAGTVPDIAAGDIFWIHWETKDIGNLKDSHSIEDRIEKISSGLIRLKQNGVTIVWTVHNYMPHNSGLDMTSIHAGRRAFLPAVDKVHVHTNHAARLVSDAYSIPAEKMLVVEHPSYFDCYEPAQTTLERQNALPKSERRRFVHIGKVQENRGGRFMWGALKALSYRRKNWELDIAGTVSRSERRGHRPIREMENVRFHDQFLPDEEFREIIASAHVCLAPFSRLLTSGSVNLALTFGLPIIGPNTDAMKDHLPNELHGFLYRDGNLRSMMFKMREVIDMPDETLSELRRVSMDHAWKARPSLQSQALRNEITSINPVSKPNKTKRPIHAKD